MFKRKDDPYDALNVGMNRKKEGLKYAANYSSTYNERTLVDKLYIDGIYSK